MADIVNNLTLRIAVLGAGEAEGELEALDIRLDSVGASSERASKGMDGFGKAMTSMKALLVGYGIYDAIKQYSDFTASMRRLQTQAGATGTEVTRQTHAIMGMATQVGTGPNSLAQGMYHLESANIRASKATNDLRIAAEGAQIGGADLTDTVTGLTAAMLAGFKGIHNASQAMGILNATVGAGDMTMQNLNEGLGTGILATLKVLGLQLNDFGAAMAVFGDNNIRGAAAANRLRMSLMTLVHPSKVAQAAMSQIGLSEFQLAEAMRRPDGLIAMLRLLKEHIGDLSKTDQSEIMASIFGGGKNSAGIMTLYDQMGRLQSKYTAVAKGQHDFNHEWELTQKTLAFSLGQLKALGQVILIDVGGVLARVLIPAAKFLLWLAHGHGAAGLLRDVLIALAAAWLLNSLRMKAVALIAGILETEFVSSELAALALATSITSLSDAAYVLTAAIDAIPLVGWIALAVTAIILLIQHWKLVKTALIDAFDWLKGHWPLVLAILTGPFGMAAYFIIKHFGQVKAFVVSVVHDIVKLFKGAVSDIKGLGKDLGFGGNGVLSYVNPVGIASHILGAFADGGMVERSGRYLVGERGPEVVNLPQGAYVQPNREIADGARGQSEAGSNMPPGTYVLQLVVDRKVLAQQVHEAGLQSQSRM